VVKPAFAWAQPQPLWELPVEARAALAAEDLVIIKGDANYRRLLGRGLHSFPLQLNLSSSVHRVTQMNS